MEITSNNIFDSKCNYLVNTVNTLGVMGSGLALEFRLRVPNMYYLYKEKCKRKEIKIGEYWVYNNIEHFPKKILNFPTKTTFSKPSKPEYLYKGLYFFRFNYKKDGIDSIALPILGARNGKLNADYSIGLIKSFLADLPIKIELCRNNMQDQFSKYVINQLKLMTIDEIFNKTSLSKYYCSKLLRNIDNIYHLSEIVSKNIIPISEAELVYSFFSKKFYKRKIIEYY
jgi:O-acetyl-ADP-ribose deacetylase (regulator of RNase III)